MELKDQITDARHLEGVPFTMLAPLVARANAATLVPQLRFSDEMAQAVLAKVTYNQALMPRDRGTMVGNAARAERFDRKIEAFLQAHPGATVLQLGVGLDTRKFRLRHCEAQWIALDLQEVMALRERLIPDPQERRVVADLRRDEWIDRVFESALPEALFVVAEGLFYYLDTPTVHRVVQTISERFMGTGCAVELFFDYYHPYFLRKGAQKAVERAKTRLTWGLKDPRELCPELRSLEFVGVEELGSVVPLAIRLYSAMFRLCALGDRPYGLASYRWNTRLV